MLPCPILHPQSAADGVCSKEGLEKVRPRNVGNVNITGRTYNGNNQEEIIHSPAPGQECLDIHPHAEEYPGQPKEQP